MSSPSASYSSCLDPFSVNYSSPLLPAKSLFSFILTGSFKYLLKADSEVFYLFLHFGLFFL